MKCLKMKVTDVLLFVVNLISIYSLNVLQDVSSSQTTTSVNGGFLRSKFDKECPQLLKIIRDNNLTDYAVDCKMVEIKPGVKDEENLLEQACFLVESMLSLMCEKKLKVTPDIFKRDKVDNQVIDCPLNFSHFQHWRNFTINNNNIELKKKLTDKDDCLKFCYDSHLRIQCVLLDQLNNYFAQYLAQHFEEEERLSADPKHTKLTIQNTENSVMTKKLEMEQQLPKRKSKSKLAQQDEVNLEVGGVSTRPEHTKLKQNTENSMVRKKQEKEQYLPESKTKEIISNSKNETTLNKAIGSNDNITKSMEAQKTEKITSTPNEEQMSKSEMKETENESPITGKQEFKTELEDQNEDLVNEDVGITNESLSASDKVDKIPTSPAKGKEVYPAERFFQAEDSHFFFYFIMLSSIIIVCYLAFHNKNKILAYALEGTSGRRNRRRPNRARYRKLETNLEEVISSNTTNSAASSVVY